MNHSSYRIGKTLLMISDLLNYFLTGKKVSDYTLESTTQLLDPEKRN
jgi:rhamnulokinase